LRASPRCNFLLRLLPHSATAAFASQHDEAVRVCLARLLDAGELPPGPAASRAHLSLHHGGLGLRSAERLAPAAYWASWADALPLLHRRLPHAAARLLQQLQAGASSTTECLQQAAASAQALAAAGFEPPPWQELTGSEAAPPATAPATAAAEADWTRGWQRAAAASLDEADLAGLRSNSTPTEQALLHSQSGPGASRHLTCLPTNTDTTFSNERFRTLLLRRLRLPLPLAQASCRCRRFLDHFGDHRAACSTAGVLGRRGVPLEVAAARICREAGARVSTNVMLRDLNLHLPPTDNRRLEVVANGLPLWQGVQLAVDTTLVSPVSRAGRPQPHCHSTPGAALARARQRKETTYPELLQTHGPGQCRLVVLAVEVGGRMSEETTTFLRLLAQARARSAPQLLKKQVASALLNRWTNLLACAAQQAFAASLLEQPLAGTANVDGQAPDLSDLVCDDRWACPPSPSRLPGPS
jgi:hypothetical protein